MEQEAFYLQTFLEAASYRISGNLLEIYNASGDRILVFVAQ
ncbi:MAG: hypothetical protein HYX86_00120 [Chloroflexi bacterium]|nr:hypothetical protein [Chloroflexota bacterium]